MIQIKISQVIIFFILIAFFLIFSSKIFHLALPVQNSLELAVFLSCFNGSCFFLSLHFVWKKTNAIFFAVFFSNLAWKIIALGGTVFFIYKNQNFHSAFALLGLVLFTFLYTGLGIALILKNFFHKSGNGFNNRLENLGSNSKVNYSHGF